MRGRAALVVWGALLVGVAAAVVALSSRGSEGVFREEQSRALAVTPARVLSAAAVESFVAKAPEPVPTHRTPPVRVRCRPQGAGPLRDPWLCTIRYRSGTRAHYSVVVQPDGQYSGVGTGLISGCCVKVPTLE